MSEKKFLDQNGVAYLWDQIFIEGVKHFATLDSLAAVVDAVDEIKLDVYDFITNEEIDKICV